MALEGNLRDFGLDAIFQLIGNNRNTGVLTTAKGEETIKVSFIQGQVVWADTQPKHVEDRLGYVLTKSGAIAPDRLTQALEIQKNTLQRLGHVLIDKRFVEPAALQKALHTQVTQIIYRLFRWNEGEFQFRQEEEIEYDKENFVPIKSESILMEGMRMLDEWPRIEKVVKNFKMIFQKTEDWEEMAGMGGTGGTGGDEGGSSSKNSEGAFDFSDLADESSESSGLPETQQHVLKLLDGVNTVQDIIDQIPVNEFEVCRAFYDLSNEAIIEEKPDMMAPGAGLRTAKKASPLANWVSRFILLVEVVLVLGSLLTSWMNPLNTFYFGDRYREVLNSTNFGISRNRLEKIDASLRIFYFSYQRYPEELKILIQRGYLGAQDVKDPWGNSYEYILTENAYLILGKNEKGEADTSLKLYYEFSTPIEDEPEEMTPLQEITVPGLTS